uniref:Uncharacterized protein n=1 Tax=Nelumbo nucifera TaxID=4432 RepID=A0A822ZJW9_NELNU|nr:TPA_asm: hypothetical protein HUJ06_000258 [Nelumbo nucifera]
MKALSKRLGKYGLRYDDLYDLMYDLDIKKHWLAFLVRSLTQGFSVWYADVGARVNQ